MLAKPIPKPDFMEQAEWDLLMATRDPAIVKVLHGANMDIHWLQRDLGLYVVNLFDTGQAARALQHARQGSKINAELSGKLLDKHAALDPQGTLVLGQAMTELGLSARAYDKIRRLARTIADLEAKQTIEPHHIAEATQYRLLDRRL